MQGVLQHLEIVGGGLLGQFDDHVAGIDTEILQQLERAARLVGRFQQGFGGDVEEHLARQFLLAETTAGAESAGHFQFAQAAGLAGYGEQAGGRVQGAVGGPAAECLIADDTSLGQRNDRLEQTVQTTLSQD